MAPNVQFVPTLNNRAWHPSPAPTDIGVQMRITILSMLAALLVACGQSSTDPAAEVKTTESETDRLNAWFEEKYEEQLQFNPIQMTFLGRKDRYDELGDFSEAGAKEQLEWRKAATEEMTASFDYDTLSDEAKMSYDIWAYETRQAEEGWQFRYNGYPFNQMQGMHTFLPTFLISFHKVGSASDMEAYIARVNELPDAFGELIKFAKTSAEKGIRPPKFAHEAVIKESKKLITGAPFDDGEDSSIWADMQTEIDTLAEQGEIDAEQAEQLKANAKAALLEGFKPAYDDIIAWVESDLPKAAENPTGVGETQPNGEAYYKHLLWTQTTTDMTADEIHQVGLDEVERLRGEMIALKDRAEDTVELAALFLSQFQASLCLPGLELNEVTLLKLRSYDWPGNVRELKNMIERSVILGEFPEEFAGMGTVTGAQAIESLDFVVQRHIMHMLDECKGNRAEAARRLGVSRKTIDRKLALWSTD
mgnify:CR=1 FL=1